MSRQITALATTVVDGDGAGEWLYAACADGSVWYCTPARPEWHQLPSIPDPEPPSAQAPAPTPPRQDLELQALKEAHGGFWGSHPDYPPEDWASEFEDDETRLGYWEWVESKLLAKAEDEDEDEDEQSAGTPVQAGDWDHAGLVRSDSRCLDLIQAQLDGKEWNADTLSTIAELVRNTGRCIDDLEQGEL